MKSLLRTLAALMLAIGLIAGSITLAAGEQGMDQAATEEATETATAEVTETATATEAPTETATAEPTGTATAEPTETATAEPTPDPDNEYIQRLVEAIIRILQEILAEAAASQ